MIKLLKLGVPILFDIHCPEVDVVAAFPAAKEYDLGSGRLSAFLGGWMFALLFPWIG
jgi:hypothetical protein